MVHDKNRVGRNLESTGSIILNGRHTLNLVETYQIRSRTSVSRTVVTLRKLLYYNPIRTNTKDKMRPQRSNIIYILIIFMINKIHLC